MKIYERIGRGARGAGLVVVAVLGLASIIASNGEEEEPSLSTIVFHSDEAGGNSLFSIESDGERLTQLTTPSAQTEDTFPVWSPDKNKIAFQRTEGDNAEIYLMDWDGTNQQNLSNHPAGDTAPAWSPDGEQLAFASQRDGNWRIYVLTLATGALRSLSGAAGGDAAWPTWSPDGQWIAYERSVEGMGHDIYVMDAANGVNQLNLTEDSIWPARFPVWSPIEAPSVPSQIAYINVGSGGTQIWLMDPNGEHKRQLTFMTGAIGQVLSRPAWSPLGERLVYATDREGPHELYKILAKDGTDITRITHSAAREGGPDW